MEYMLKLRIKKHSTGEKLIKEICIFDSKSQIVKLV